jgi:hypothetical protein
MTIAEGSLVFRVTLLAGGKNLLALFALVSRYDFVVLAHALNHQVLNELPNPQLKLVEGVGQRSLNDLLVIAGPFLNLLEKESVLLGKVRTETLV